jgi:hypothetical protein
MKRRAEVRSNAVVSPLRAMGAGFAEQIRKDLMNNLRENATEDIKRRREKGIDL